MHPEQNGVIDELIGKMRAGRMSRRGFVQRALAVGMTSTAAITLLEACGGGGDAGSGGTKRLVWLSDNDATGTYKGIVDSFNNGIGKQKGIFIDWQNGPTDTNDMLTRYNNNFRARDSSLDIISIDIVYPAQFAAAQWTKPIDDSMWPSTEREKYLQGPIKGCTFEGKLWAAPFRTDLGLLYYRKDLVSSAPKTWDDLVSSAKGASPSKAEFGYAWQAAQYEGLVCNFVEVLHGYGGAVLDPNDATKVTVNSPEAEAALKQMVGWVGTISPTAITTYKEDQSLAVWEQGKAVFMRNWPYAYVRSNDAKESKIPEKFEIAPLPYGGKETTGHSAIGGWNLAISRYSKHQDEAWEFIKYALSPEAQKKGATGATWTVTLQSIYDDADVLKAAPLFGKLKPILQDALPRPVSPKYVNVSEVIQRNVFKALKKDATPAEALKTLEADLKNVVTK